MSLLTELKGYRKWSVAAMTLICALVLAMKGKLTADWTQIAIAVNAAFSAANAFEHHKTAPK